MLLGRKDSPTRLPCRPAYKSGASKDDAGYPALQSPRQEVGAALFCQQSKLCDACRPQNGEATEQTIQVNAPGCCGTSCAL